MKNFLQKRQLIIYFALGAFLSIFFSLNKVFSQCVPYINAYDGRNTAFIATANQSENDSDILSWETKSGLWNKCKGNSRFFDVNKYPPYLTANDLNNVYIEIQEGTYIRADKIQGGNNLTLVVCGKLYVSKFEIPDVNFSVRKNADPKTFAAVGDMITYTIVVSNFDDSNFLNEVVVNDPELDFTYDFGTLEPSQSKNTTASYYITADDMANRYFENTVTATAKVTGGSITDSYTETIYYSPFSVTKTASIGSFSEVGEIINYTITVKNLTSSDLSNVIVEDNLFSGFEYSEVYSWTETIELPAGETRTYSTSYSITAADLAAPFIYNSVTASVDDQDPASSFVYVENDLYVESGDSFFAEDGFEGIGKVDPQNNTFFNRVRIFICPGGELIMDNVYAMNGVQIYNYGSFVFEYIQAGPAQGGGVVFCLTGPGIYTDQNGEPIINVEEVVDENGDVIDHIYTVVKPDAFDNIVHWMTGPDCNIPLPIELLSFTPSIKPDRIELNWTTGTEINNDYFTLERSRDLYGWDILGFVPGAGNSSIPLNYTFSDLQPLDGLAYYRLKQTDFDGQFEYFGPISAHYDLGMEGLDFKVLKQYTNWVIAVPNDGIYQVEVYNLMGHRLVSEKIENTLTIQAPEGAVVIRVTDGYARSASRVVM
jgi:uncharacterized repeat protein (TIGR01451 family)